MGFAEEWLVFPDRYGGHLTLSLGAILAGLVISVPLGILAARSRNVAQPALGFASIVQTIPGLALLALMVPLLGGRIGFWPAFLALTLYSILPILRNTIVGLQGVDAKVREAALAVGMTEAQRLHQVDLPLAAPVMVAGLRTAAVWVVGAATLSTPVGAESLGNYIFQGLQTRDWGTVAFGCLAAAFLALVLDQSIAQFEAAAHKRHRGHALAGLAGLALVLAPLLGGVLPKLSPGPPTETVLESGAPPFATSRTPGTITVASKAFTEQYILADLVRRLLEEAGAEVKTLEGLGSTVGFDAVRTGEADVMIDYTGTIWATVMKRDDPVVRDVMFDEMSAWLTQQHKMAAFGRLGFENAYAFAVTRETAERHDLTSISDLVGLDLSIASDPEFFGRPEWVRVREAYGLGSLTPRGMDATFMYDAARNGEVDIITAYTTDGRIDVYELVLLDDPLGALPPYDAFILLSPDALSNPSLLAALEPLRSAISSADMRAANGMVDLERRSLREAGAWLYQQVVRDDATP